jgi:hypothetical protein
MKLWIESQVVSLLYFQSDLFVGGQAFQPRLCYEIKKRRCQNLSLQISLKSSLLQLRDRGLFPFKWLCHWPRSFLIRLIFKPRQHRAGDRPLSCPPHLLQKLSAAFAEMALVFFFARFHEASSWMLNFSHHYSDIDIFNSTLEFY